MTVKGTAWIISVARYTQGDFMNGCGKIGLTCLFSLVLVIPWSTQSFWKPSTFAEA
jgi:hypothetical protein